MQSLYGHESKVDRSIVRAGEMRHPRGERGGSRLHQGLLLQLLPFPSAMAWWPAFLQAKLEHLFRIIRTDFAKCWGDAGMCLPCC